MIGKRHLAGLTALYLFWVNAPGTAVAGEDPAARIPDAAAALGLASTSSVQLTARALYWADHRLMEICSMFGGRFARLNASELYECRLPEIQAQTFQAASR